VHGPGANLGARAHPAPAPVTPVPQLGPSLRSGSGDADVRDGEPLAIFAVLRSPSHETAWAVGTAVVALVVMVLRAPFAWNTVWAEDGQIFLEDSVSRGVRSFGHFYAGYLHSVPRLGSTLAAAFDLRWAAWIIATFAAVIVATCAGVVEVVSGAHIRRRWIRVGLGVSVAMLPSLRVESIANLANLQFLLVFATFWILLWLPVKGSSQMAASILIVGTALSSLVGAAFIPLAVYRLRSRSGRPLALVFLATTVLHGALVLVLRPSRQFRSGSLVHTVPGYLRNVLAGHMIGAFNASHASLRGLLAVVLLAAVFIVGISRSGFRTTRTMLAGLAIVFSGGIYVAETLSAGVAPRYAVLPGLLIVAALALETDQVLDQARQGLRSPTVATVAAVAAGCVLLSSALSFRPTAFRSSGPRWTSRLREAQMQCRSGQGAATVQILPANAAWTVAIPCSSLASP